MRKLVCRVLVIGPMTGLLCGSVAFAQTLPPPPLTQTVDAHGVDLVRGSFDLPGVKMNIGTPQSGISVSRAGLTITNEGGQANLYRYGQDSLTGTLNYCEIGHFPQLGCFETNPSYSYMVVSYGGKSEKFWFKNSSYVGYDGATGQLTCTTTTCTYTLKDGTVVEFDKSRTNLLQVDSRSGATSKVTRPDGEVLTYTYVSGYNYFGQTGVSRASVTSSLGWMVKQNISGQYKLINTSVNYCDPAANNCDSLTQYPTVTNFVDAIGNTYTLGTPVNPREFILISPTGISTVIRYSGYVVGFPLTGKVSYVSRGGSAWNYTYAFDTHWPVNSQPFGPVVTTVTSPTNSIVRLSSVPSHGFVLQVADELGRANTTLARDTLGNITKAIDPDATYSSSSTDPLDFTAVQSGGYTTYAYDGRGNPTSVTKVPKPGYGLNNSVWQAQYPSTCTNVKTCNKPNYMIDPNGNQTDFVYDQTGAHGGLLSQTGPADTSGVRPQTRYTYTQLYPKVLNASNGLVNSTPVWRVSRTSSCRTATVANPASCVGTDQETVTEYEYGTNNLLMTKMTVRAGNANVLVAASATNVWATTTYAYDDIGNLLMVDGPLPGAEDQTFTMYDVLRRPVYEIGGDADGGGALPRVTIHHLYDPDGREYRTETGTGYGTLLQSCSTTAATCAYYTVASYTQRTYDPTTGLEVKSITAQP